MSQPQNIAVANAHRRSRQYLHQSARHRNTPHCQQVVERKVQADAEHEQHHTDFGKLASKLDVRDKPRRGRSDEDASQQIAYQRRHMQTRGNKAKKHRQPQGCDDSCNQADVMGHSVNSHRVIGSLLDCDYSEPEHERCLQHRWRINSQ